MKKNALIRTSGLVAGACLIAASLGLSACSSTPEGYADGTYTAQSQIWESEDGTDDGNGYGVITMTIEGGVITEAEFLTYEPDGTLKDEDYGKANGAVANQDYYNKAQRAVAASTEYGVQLVEVGNPADVELISGATISYNEFQEACEIALDEAAAAYEAQQG